MKTKREEGRLIIRDQPLVFWMFYSCFVFGGLAALILALAYPPDKTTAFFVSIIGIGNIAGGVYMIRREPASILIFDSETGNLLVRRWNPTGRRDSSYPLGCWFEKLPFFFISRKVCGDLGGLLHILESEDCLAFLTFSNCRAQYH